MVETKGYIKVNQYFGKVPIERTFKCRNCGMTVNVVDAKDKRTVFCSQKCEKKYWRDKSKQDALKKKRGRETSNLRNYSTSQIAKKLWLEKKEAEENY